MYESLMKVITGYGLISGFAIIGATMWISYWLSDKLTKGRLHGSAVAILIGLLLSYIGGVVTGGQKGLVDIALFSGIGLLGGAMLRDFAIVATGFGVSVDELKRAGMVGVLALFIGVLASFVAGVAVAFAFGYTDAVSLTTIGTGAVTYIVGPVTGAAIGASSEVMALSIAAGLVKAIVVMVATPFVAPYIGLNNPRRGRRPGGHRSEAGALRLPDRGVLHRAGLPARAIAAVLRHARIVGLTAALMSGRPRSGRSRRALCSAECFMGGESLPSASSECGGYSGRVFWQGRLRIATECRNRR